MKRGRWKPRWVFGKGSIQLCYNLTRVDMRLFSVGSDLRGEVSVGADRKRGGGQTDRNGFSKATSKRPDSDLKSGNTSQRYGSIWSRPRDLGGGRRDICCPLVAKRGNSA